jgi:hypothetical protein
MSTAFVLGNGRSRLDVDLTRLKTYGSIYGCNALYREFTPDVLISTDRPISTRIQEEGYALKNRMYTRKPVPGSGAQRVCQEYYGFSSGPIAVAQACLDRHNTVYLIGFDLGPLPNDRFNNVYADTEFYKKSSARPTFSGNWVRQIVQIVKRFNEYNFIRVMGDCTSTIDQFRDCPNLVSMPMAEFLDRINNLKGV